MAVRGILLAVVLTGALVGCSSPAGPGAQPWAASVCATLATWRSAITDLNQRAAAAMNATTTTEQTRANLLELVAGARDATEDARAAVAAAGVPAVEGGEQVAHGFTESLAKTRDAYAGAEADLRALPAQDETTFYDGVVAVLGRLSAEYDKAGRDLQTLDSPALRQAFDNTPECQ
jgi:hypothetical protein